MFCTEVTLCYVVDQISTNFLNQNTDYIKQEPFYVPNSLRLEKKHIIQLFVSDMLVYIKLCGTNPNESKFRSWRNWKQTEVAECLPSFGAKSYVLQSAIQKFKDWDIQNYNFPGGFVWVWNLVVDIEGRKEAEGVWEYGVEENNWIEEERGNGRMEEIA